MKINNLIIGIIFLLSISTIANIKRTVTDLPDISVIGNFLASSQKNNNRFDIEELEISFQHYLYPTVKANIFTALHKNEEGQHAIELEEAYVDFYDVFNIILPESSNVGIGSSIGKKFLGIGKINPLHPEQRSFIDRPLAVQTFLGGEESLSAEGGQISYLLPLSFFSQLELGAWTANKDDGHTHAHESDHKVEYKNRLISGRLWNSVSLSDSQELELGLNYLKGNATSSSEKDQQQLVGIDIGFAQDFNVNQALEIKAEYYEATYGESGEPREKQSGGFISGLYKFNPYYKAGIRFGTLEKFGDEALAKNQYSLLLTRKLTETSQFRVQYNTGRNVENTVYAQFIFGMGPHSHVLQ